MNRYFSLAVVFTLLFLAFVLLLFQSEAARHVSEMINRVRRSVDEQDRRTRLLKRKMLSELESKNSILLRLERDIEYSRIRKRLPGITGGKIIVAGFIVSACGLVVGISYRSIFIGVLLPLGYAAIVFAIIRWGRMRALSKVSEELPKFLDFLGNYSITTGEITGIFSQISPYLSNPLSQVVDEFVAESRVSGDTGMALLTMADKLEHPQFKQLIRNVEITARYSADFKSLVADSRRSMREFLTQSRERKSILREAAINMGLLLIMSVVVIVMVNILIGGSVTEILLHTFVGKIAIGAMVFIFFLFGMQVMKIDR